MSTFNVSGATIDSGGTTVIVSTSTTNLPITPTTGASGFSVAADGNSLTVLNAYRYATNSSSVIVVLSSPVYAGQTATLTVSSSNVADSLANTLANTTNFAVTNDSQQISANDSNNLITVSRAVQNDTLSQLNDSNPTALASIIAAASRMIEQYCHRTFALTDYTQVYSGGGMPYMEIQLENYPVTDISRVATSPQSVLLITNSSSSNQRATVATTSTGLRLVRVSSAVTTTSDLAFATYTTLNALVTAINLLGNGWSASVVSPYGDYPSADLLPMQGAATAKDGGVRIELYTEDSPYWGASGIWTTPWGYVGDGPGWRADTDIGYLIGCFPQGVRNIRIDYTAGYSTIPEDVQEACVQLCQDLYQASLINNNVQSAKLGPFSYTLADKSSNPSGQAAFSAKVKGLLQGYVAHSNLIVRRGPEYVG